MPIPVYAQQPAAAGTFRRVDEFDKHHLKPAGSGKTATLTATDIWDISQSELFDRYETNCKIPSTLNGILSLGADKETVWAMLRAMIGQDNGNDRKRKQRSFDTNEKPRKPRKVEKLPKKFSNGAKLPPTAMASALIEPALSCVDLTAPTFQNTRLLCDETSQTHYGNNRQVLHPEQYPQAPMNGRLPFTGNDEKMIEDWQCQYRSAKQHAIAELMYNPKLPSVLSHGSVMEKHPSNSKHQLPRLKPPPEDVKSLSRPNRLLPPRRHSVQLPSILSRLLPNCQIKSYREKLWRQRRPADPPSLERQRNQSPGISYHEILLEEIDLPSEIDVEQLIEEFG